MELVIATTKKAILDHYYVRGKVFIIEQKISWDIEFDEHDYDAIFFVLYNQDVPIGAARLYKNKVGRVAVLKEHRHHHMGSFIMKGLEEHARKLGYASLELGAQCSVVSFYEKLGYVSYGDIFLDANIEHLMMKKIL